jgi:energy-coupling factor transporter ATP-binding protein EcfA2
MLSPKEFELEKGVITEESLEFAKIELGKVYEDMIYLIEQYMDMPIEYIKIVAVWIIGTYFHSTFNSYPFLFINAMRGSGKTRLLKIISHLAKDARGHVQTGITESVLFRMPQGRTLILDECESIGTKEKAILREYLNACYKSGGVVVRMKKAFFKGQEEFIPDDFHPYKPIALANIWGMEEVLGDRCVSFILEKSDSPIKTKKQEDFDINPRFQQIKRSLDKISVVCAVKLREKNYISAWNVYINIKYTTLYTLNTYNAYNTLNTPNEINEEVFFNKIDELNINGRNLELLFPLFIISKYISQEVFEEILNIGTDLLMRRKEDEFSESADVMVYEFISKQENEREWKSIKDLTYFFRNFAGGEEWMNEKWFGRALKRLNLVINKRRTNAGISVMVNILKAREKIKIFGGNE